MENFNQNFREKIEKLAVNYVDLATERIEKIREARSFGTTEMCEIQESVRVIAHITTTLERINRLEPNKQ